MTGFIKVYRELLHSGLLKNPAMLQVWLFLSSQVWFRKTVIDGIEILPGQVLITASAIACACGLQEHKVRYALRCLAKQGLIRRENIRNRYSLITVLDPSENRALQAEKPTAPSEDVPVTVQTEPPVQAENEQKNCYGMNQNVYLTAEEKRMLHERSTAADSYIDNLSAYKRRTHKEYDDDFSVLCEWICKDDISEKRSAARQASLQLRREKEQSAKQDTTPQPRAEKHFMPTTTSYDLALAENRAHENVPTLRKRRQPNT